MNQRQTSTSPDVRTGQLVGPRRDNRGARAIALGR